MATDFLYMRICRDLKAAILNGTYPAGAQLPSEHTLSRSYGVQRDTVRRALDVLAREGLIIKRPGRGSFVCSADDAVTVSIDPAHLKNPIISDLLRRLTRPPGE